MLIICCAKIFGDYLNMVRLPEMVSSWLLSLNLPPMGMMLMLQGLLILGGMFVDAASLVVITTPILLPLVKGLGFDPLWYGIVLVINLELAVVTPPVGLNLYTLRGCCPFLTVEQIIRAAIPFLFVQLACLLLFTLYPPLALWLPSFMK
jgi:C4-dicarboxylate transporter DctM subunit